MEKSLLDAIDIRSQGPQQLGSIFFPGRNLNNVAATSNVTPFLGGA